MIIKDAIYNLILNGGRSFAHKNLLSLFGGVGLVLILNKLFPQLKAMTFDQYGMFPVFCVGILITWGITEILYLLSEVFDIDIFKPVLSVWAAIRMGAIIACILGLIPLDKIVSSVIKTEASDIVITAIVFGGGILTAVITAIILIKNDDNSDMDNESILTRIFGGIKDWFSPVEHKRHLTEEELLMEIAQTKAETQAKIQAEKRAWNQMLANEADKRRRADEAFAAAKRNASASKAKEESWDEETFKKRQAEAEAYARKLIEETERERALEEERKRREALEAQKKSQ